MASPDIDAVDAIVCQMLDAMRNAHLQVVLGDPLQVIGQRMGTLRDLVRDSLAQAMTAKQVVALVEKPLARSTTRGGDK
jgi:hypothetical protein